MIYNFTRFVEWPTTAWRDARSAMVVGVLGEDPFGSEFEQVLRGKKYGRRSIEVHKLHSITEIEGCHVLLISKSENKLLAEILHRAQAANVLTVSDMDELGQIGGAIGFVAANRDAGIKCRVTVGVYFLSGLKIENAPNLGDYRPKLDRSNPC